VCPCRSPWASCATRNGDSSEPVTATGPDAGAARLGRAAATRNGGRSGPVTAPGAAPAPHGSDRALGRHGASGPVPATGAGRAPHRLRQGAPSVSAACSELGIEPVFWKEEKEETRDVLTMVPA
jgi:hypothetical protein